MGTLFSFLKKNLISDDFGNAGTRFRPLSLNTPKPLFPLAGQPMVNHPISACKKVGFPILDAFCILFISSNE